MPRTDFVRAFALAVPVVFAACAVQPAGESRSDSEATAHTSEDLVRCFPCGFDINSPTDYSHYCGNLTGNFTKSSCDGPYCPVHVYNYSGTPGTVLVNPKVMAVFWGSYFQGLWSPAFYHTAYLESVVDSAQFWGRTPEYGMGQGSFVNAFVRDTSLSSSTPTMTEAQVENELTNEFSSGDLPPPDPNTIYVVFLPDGVRMDGDASSGVTGYHHFFIPQGFGVRVFFGVIDGYDTLDARNLVAAHEILEAASDPIDDYPGPGLGINVPFMQGGEIEDLCRGTETIAGQTVPMVWSQLACACK